MINGAPIRLENGLDSFVQFTYNLKDERFSRKLTCKGTFKADGVARQHCSDCAYILSDSELMSLLFMVIVGILGCAGILGCTGSSGAQVRPLGLPLLFLKLTLTSLG